MLLRNAAALLGPGLEYAPSTDLRVARGRFGRVRPGARPLPGEETVDCEGLLAVPGLVNAHTHVGDSIAKDAVLGRGTDGSVHPVRGAKARILARSGRGHLLSFMRAACRSMLARGVTAFADFREGGARGAELLREAASGVPIRAVVLGRLEAYHGARQIRLGRRLSGPERAELARVSAACDGLGVSGANECSDPALRAYARAPGLRAIHCSETRQSVAASRRRTGRSETSRALQMRPHFLVHMTRASGADLRLAARRTRGIVVCPRSNAALGGGAPDVAAMAAAGCTVAIGTDNVMVNPPDMLREMDYLWKSSSAAGAGLGPADVLRMATVNGARLLGLPAGAIERGRLADCVFVDRRSADLSPMHDPHAAVVHRATESSIRAVMVGGRIAHGRL